MASCKICCEPFRRPVILPCGHSLCQDCAVHWAKKCEEREINKPCVKKKQELKATNRPVTPGTLSCPTCREVHIIPPEGAGAFTRNYDLSAADPMCDWCDGNEAAVKCRECAEWLCKECCDSHKKIKSKRSHTLFTVHQVAAGELKEKFRPCSKHDKKLIDLFCTVCKEPCCPTGRATVHHEHTCITLQEKQEEVCGNVKGALEEREEFLHFICQLWKQMENMKGENKKHIVQKLKTRKEVFDKMYDKMIKTLNDSEHDNNACKQTGVLLEEVRGRKVELEGVLKQLTPGDLQEKEKEVLKLVEFEVNVKDLPEPMFEEFTLTDDKDASSCSIKEFLGTLSKISIKQTCLFVREINSKTSTDTYIITELMDVAVMSNGLIVVVDSVRRNCKVKVFDAEGSLLVESKEAQFISWSVTSIPGDPDHLIVSCGQNGLAKWNIQSGNSVILNSKISRNVSHTRYNDKVVLVVFDHNSNKLKLLCPDTGNIIGNYGIKDIPYASYIAGHGSHNLIAVRHENKVSMFKQGKRIWNIGEGVLSLPEGMCMTRSKKLIVADYGSPPYGVMLFSETGHVLGKLLSGEGPGNMITEQQAVAYDDDRHTLVVAEWSTCKIKLFKCWL